MFGYLAVTMSATCSQAFFSTSEPDHMNQFRVTFPSLDSEDPELSPPPQPAMRTVAMAIETIEVRRDIRMPLLSESRLSTPIVVVGAGRDRRMRGRENAARAPVATSPIAGGAPPSPDTAAAVPECSSSDSRCL